MEENKLRTQEWRWEGGGMHGCCIPRLLCLLSQGEEEDHNKALTDGFFSFLIRFFSFPFLSQRCFFLPPRDVPNDAP